MARKLTDEDLRLNIIVNGDGAKRAILDQQKEVETLKKKIGECSKVLDDFKAKGGDTDSAKYKNSVRILDDYKAKLTAAESRLASLTRQQNINKMTMAELSRHIKLTGIALKQAEPGTKNWKNLSTELRNAKERMAELREQSNATGNVIQKLGSIKAGFLGAIGAISGAVAGIASGFRKIAEFEQANANLATILGQSVSDISSLTETARQLGATTEYTASQVTRLQTELAKLGFQQETIKGMQKSVLQFSTAVGADLGEAAALAGASLRMFGLSANDTEEALGVMALATNKSALSFSYLQNSLSTVGPVAKTFGFSLKDTVTLLGTLANAGFDASSAATATRNILLNLADANGKLAKKIGGSVQDFNSLMDAFAQLDAQGVDLAETLELTDKRSVAAFNQFLSGADSARELHAELGNVKGALQDISEARMDTLEGSIKKLQSAWEGLILSMSGSKGILKGIVDFLSDAVNGLAIILNPGKAVKDFRQRREDADLESFNDVYQYYGADMARQVIEDALAKQQEIVDTKRGDAYAKAVRRIEEIKRAAERFEEQLREEAASIEAPKATEEVPKSPTEKPLEKKPSETAKPEAKEKWSLEEDEEYIRKSVELRQRFRDGDIEDENLYQYRLSQIQIEALQTRLASGKDDADARKKLQKQLRESLEKEEDQLLQLPFKTMREKQKIIDQELESLQLYYDADRGLIQSSAELVQSTMDRGSTALYDNKRKENEKLVALDLEYLSKMKDVLERVIAEGTIDGVALSDEVLANFQKKLNDIVSKIAKVKKENRQDLPDETDENGELVKRRPDWLGGTGQGSLFGVTQEQWNQFFYNLSHSKTQAEDVLNTISGIGGAASEGFKLASQAIEMVAAKEQKELKAYKKANDTKRKELKKRLDNGQITQAQYDSAIERMKNKEEARDEAMQLRQAQRTKRMNISKAIIETSLGVTKTLAQWGIPWGIAPAAIMAAMGAAQVAMMSATPVSGKAKGGQLDENAGTIAVRRKEDGKMFQARLSPEKRGFVSRPTVIVGESGSEYVIPHEALENPTILPFIGTIETARRNGSLKNIDLSAAGLGVAVPGRASGGFAAEGASGLQSVQAPSSVIDPELKAALKRLNEILSSPIRADVSMLGPRGIVAKSEEYARQRKGGRI